MGEAAAGPPGPVIDHVYVGHLTRLSHPSPSMCQISRGVTRCAAGDEAGRLPGQQEGATRQSPQPTETGLIESDHHLQLRLISGIKIHFEEQQSLFVVEFSFFFLLLSPGNKLALGLPFISSTEGRHGSL